MNESIDTKGGTIDDAAVIARLRGALDEVTASPVAERPRMATGGGGSVGAGRWLAIAAAIVLIGGGVTAIVVNRNHHSAAPADSTPTAPTVPTEPTLIRTVVPWFVLNSPDLQRGEEVFEECCDPNANLVMAWRNGDQYVTMTEALGEFAASDAAGRLVVPSDGGVLLFDSVGLTDDELVAAAWAVVPGSGVPYVLPMEGWGMVGFGYADSGSQRSQLYTALNQPPESSLLPTATITVGEYRGELEWVATFTSVETATIAGYDGWKLTNRDDSVIVVWTTDDGSWATLRIDAALAERVDGLIAAVSEVPQGDDPTVDGGPDPVVDTVLVPPAAEGADPVITGDLLPVYDSSADDQAVGMPAPAVVGYDFLGNEITIDPTQGAHLVVFAAHWCPHCNAEMPQLITAIGDGTIPSWLPVTLVSTAESENAANYPPAEWLASRGWTGRTIRDGVDGDGAAGTIAQAYGATGWPYFVLIGGDGNIAARASGEMEVEQIGEFVSRLQGLTAVGRLRIPSIDVDLTVVSPGDAGLNADRQESPVLIAGPGTDAGIGVVWGHRTMYGAPFERLDELQPGDTITWTDEGDTLTFEVISVITTDDPDAAAVPDGTTLQLRTFTPEYTSQQTLVVYARTVA